ncbi:hypothetical protein [Haloferula sp. A504]|uniref:hypothetical protein n=1 Tax=Haloferula sp. A504 TaxID=3373601 RepID=UPI0031C08F7D|nr:hypothetical protein [Verrucomicrobiaceae bacterium E54]
MTDDSSQLSPPDWATCTEEELWRYVAWHLEGAGIRSVLVGGAVVSIYTEGLYRSGDLDLVPDDLGRSRLEPVLREIGFAPTRSRYFKHPECPHLFLEFPRGPVEIGEEFPITPEEVEVAGRTLRLLSPTDSVKDRLAGYIHWQARANFDQAVLICRRQAERVDLAAVERWCRAEGGREAYNELVGRLTATG